MKTTFTKKITKNNKNLVKKVAKAAKRNPNATVAIAATAGTGFLGLGVLNVVQHMRNKKALKKAKAMDKAQASSANANDTQQPPVQEPQQAEPTTNNETSTNTSNTTSGEQAFPAMIQAAFNEFMVVRKDPRSQGWTDEQLADATAHRFASDPLSISCIYTYIMDTIAKINFKNLQATAMGTTQTSEQNVEVFDEPEETDDTNPDEGKYPASSKKQQQNGKKGNNKK